MLGLVRRKPSSVAMDRIALTIGVLDVVIAVWSLSSLLVLVGLVSAVATPHRLRISVSSGGAIPAAFRVTESPVTSTGVVLVSYERAGDVETGSF